jgi:hypothetical protein
MVISFSEILANCPEFDITKLQSNCCNNKNSIEMKLLYNYISLEYELSNCLGDMEPEDAQVIADQYLAILNSYCPVNCS